MKANTAVCFVLSGVALLLSDAKPHAPGFHRIARAATWAVFALSLGTILEFSFGWDFGIDQAMFPDTANRDGLSIPGRMSLLTALDFIILSGALWLLDYKTRKGFWPAPLLALAAGIPAMLGLTGYVYSIVWLYRPFSHSAMALHTSLILLMMSIGIICARPDRRPLAVIFSDGPGGLMARRILPASILFPLAVGWLRLEGQRRGWYGLEVGVAIFTVSSIVFLTSLVFWASAESDRRDIERRGIEDASERLRTASLAKEHEP